MNRKVILPLLFMTALFVLSCSTSKKTNTATGKSIDIKNICTISSKEPCWIELENKKGCYLYNGAPEPNETVTWSGDCKNKMTEGKGELIWYVKEKKYDAYNGEMHLGVREGKGIYKTARYQYKGEYKNDFSEGYGELLTNTNEVYKGFWAKGKMNGKGKLTLSDGVSLDGEWHAGLLNGQATVRNPKAQSTYTGEMKNSQKNGKGKLVFDNGVVWLATYKNNKLDGEVIIIKKDGTKINTVWKDGELVTPTNK